jgi:IS30 family transposase
LEAPVYFADPYSSWQKGDIENENGFIRQYIPQSTKMEDVSHQEVNHIMQKINRREKLNFATPEECFYQNTL